MTENNPSPPNHPRQSAAYSWLRNLVVITAAVILGITILLGIRTQTATASLPELAATAVPYEAALRNGKPTFLEFYANWCTSCQAMAGDMAELRRRYGDQVNFVMLNVDNTKWLPEMLNYRVDGIPHFVYLDRQGEAVATAIGEQPRLVLTDNLEALVAQQTLPHIQRLGRVSELENNPLSDQSKVNDDPRSHGGQVVQ